MYAKIRHIRALCLHLTYAPFLVFYLFFKVAGKLDNFLTVKLRRCSPSQTLHRLYPALSIVINHPLPVSQNVVRLFHTPEVARGALHLNIRLIQLKDSSASRDKVTALHVLVVVYLAASYALAVSVVI